MSIINPSFNRLENITARVKKITEALYRITDFFPDREPMKWALRDKALKILDFSLTVKNSPPKNVSELSDALHSIEKILDLLDLASVGSFAAKSNFDVLEREYRSVLNFVADLNKNMLHTATASLKLLLDQTVKPKIEELTASPYFQPDEVKIEQNRSDGLQFSQRHAKILSLVMEKKKVSVADISAFFEGISEKTIQRDLISLVNRGLLDMNGDRRWRRYLLKKSQ